MNRVVAHFQDGRLLKGVTNDFLPTKDRFHLLPSDSSPTAKPLEVLLAELKALFFVRDLKGRPERRELHNFDPSKPPAGRKIRVAFKDGEILMGTTQGYQPGRPGFFLVPADAGSNNERIYIVAAAAKEISLF